MKPLKPIAWHRRQCAIAVKFLAWSTERRFVLRDAGPSLTVRVVTSDNKILASKTFRRALAVDDGPEAIAPTVCSVRRVPGQVGSVATVIDQP